MKNVKDDLLRELVILAEEYWFLNQTEKMKFHQLLGECDYELLKKLEAHILKKKNQCSANAVSVVRTYCEELEKSTELEKDIDLYHDEYEKAQAILGTMTTFGSMTREEKINYIKDLSLETRDTLGFVLEGIPVKGYEEFREQVVSLFINKICTNEKQVRFIYESLMNESDNRKRKENGEIVDFDSFNSGKHCDKFSKRSSHQKKAKGKAYARVRVVKISF